MGFGFAPKRAKLHAEV